MPVTLTDEEFALLFDYLDREHTITFDPDYIGLTPRHWKQVLGPCPGDRGRTWPDSPTQG